MSIRDDIRELAASIDELAVSVDDEGGYPSEVREYLDEAWECVMAALQSVPANLS